MEDCEDTQILRNIFLKSLELADPVKNLERIKFEPPSGTLVFIAVGKGAGRLAKAFKINYSGQADGIVVIPENESCEEIGFEVIKATHPIPSQQVLKHRINYLKKFQNLERMTC